MAEKKRIRELVIVEGKCDVSAVKAAVDCDVIETKGFGIYNDSDLVTLIRAAAGDRGVVILTDSDRSGFKIRSRLKSVLGGIELKQAYIPQIPGKERRKAQPSADGYLGVEAMGPQTIVDALTMAGATFDDGVSLGGKGGITKADMFALGLTGRPDSGAKRSALLKSLGLPEGITAKAMLEVLNIMFDREGLTSYLSQL